MCTLTPTPRGVWNIEHPQGAFIEPIQLSFVECSSSFWEVTDRLVARKVTLFHKWKCIILKGAMWTPLLTGASSVLDKVWRG